MPISFSNLHLKPPPDHQPPLQFEHDMEDLVSQPLVINLMFGWPYKFFNTQDIQEQYKSKYGGHEISIAFDNDHKIFHFNCKYEDAEYHTINFTRFINGYIDEELSKSTGDVLSQDAIQIERLHIDDNTRSRYFERARSSAAHYQQDYEMLIGSESFQVILPYNSRVARDKHINRQLFKDIAQIKGCGLYWLKGGLQVLSENEENLQTMADLLRPVLNLLDGIYGDLYWAENLSQLKFHFRRLARPVDHSIYKLQDFSSTHLDLHLTRWDPSSLQDLTLRPVILGKIEYPAGTKNPWLKRKSFQYGLDESNPNRWMSVPFETISSKFMYTERANQIHDWVQQIDNDLEDSTLDNQVPTVVAPLVSSRRVSEAISIEESKSKEQANSLEQVKKTDIVEHRRLQENYDFDKPRVRAAPRLKAASNNSSAIASGHSKGDTKPRLQFIDILTQFATKLMSAVAFFDHKASSLTVNFGQLFIPLAIVPPVCRPDAGINQEGFLPTDWARIFSKSDKSSSPTRPYFSQRLTSSADDALYMSMTIPGSDGYYTTLRPVFHIKPCSNRTSYKLRCQNQITGTTATVTVDQKGRAEIQSSSQEIGYVNVHFPQFIWDARFTYSAEHKLSEDDADAFQQLLDTIWIGSGLDMPIQEETVYFRKVPRITVLSCQCHRKQVFRSAKDIPDEKAIYLHITRIEDLQASDMSLAGDEVYAYTRALQFSNQGNVDDSRQEQNLWYEAHLTSALIDSLLLHASGPVHLDQTKTSTQTLVPLQQDLNFQNSLREALIPLLDITQNLIKEWNNIGSSDRVEPARLGSSSIITQSTPNNHKDRSTGDVFATGNRGKTATRDEKRPKQKI